MSGRWTKAAGTLGWLPAFAWQRLTRRPPRGAPVHLILALADHFEPSIVPEAPKRWAEADVQERRVERWCREYPRAFSRWRDADGRPFRHTYFYPAEQYSKALIDRLADHCHAGWGELEIHLHHGVDGASDAAATRRILLDFRDRLAERGCLAHWDGGGDPAYAFVHGNWALANVTGGRNCGVDNEMQILAETGCYADLTLPSAPDPTQIRKINALYECRAPLAGRAPHRRGRDLRVGRRPRVFPLIVQGPLALAVERQWTRWPRTRLENGEVSGSNPPTFARLARWERAAIGVRGRPEWLFVKLHCHGMDPRDEPAMLGDRIQTFLRDLTGAALTSGVRLHFVTAREMVNIALAACDGADGDPGRYRDYRLRPLAPPRRA